MDEIPHNDLWLQAHRDMDLDSASRAYADALQSVLEKRLYRMDPEEHRRYAEVECTRIVETLRVLCDTYREYLQTKIDGPLVEMYWVVVRFGIKDWAVMRLRSAAIRYIVASRILHADWNELYGFEQTAFCGQTTEKLGQSASYSSLLWSQRKRPFSPSSELKSSTK